MRKFSSIIKLCGGLSLRLMWWESFTAPTTTTTKAEVSGINQTTWPCHCGPICRRSFIDMFRDSLENISTCVAFCLSAMTNLAKWNIQTQNRDIHIKNISLRCWQSALKVLQKGTFVHFSFLWISQPLSFICCGPLKRGQRQLVP